MSLGGSAAFAANIATHLDLSSSPPLAKPLAAAGEVAAADRLELLPSYPNPFNASTVIPLFVPDGVPLVLDIHSVLGQRVRRLLHTPMSPGVVRVIWDGLDDRGRPVSSGVYLYRVSAGQWLRTGRMLLLR